MHVTSICTMLRLTLKLSKDVGDNSHCQVSERYASTLRALKEQLCLQEVTMEIKPIRRRVQSAESDLPIMRLKLRRALADVHKCEHTLQEPKVYSSNYIHS
jgi:pantothenate kinase